MDVVSTGIIYVVLVVLLDTCAEMLSGVTWAGVNLVNGILGFKDSFQNFLKGYIRNEIFEWVA